MRRLLSVRQPDGAERPRAGYPSFSGSLERDANIQRALARHDPGYRVTEDRSLEVLSSKKLSFSDDVEAALGVERPARCAGTPQAEMRVNKEWT